MDNQNSISDEQLSIIASLTDLENRVEELYGLVNQDDKGNDLTKRVEKLEKKISKLSKKLDGLQEINSSLNRNISRMIYCSIKAYDGIVFTTKCSISNYKINNG